MGRIAYRPAAVLWLVMAASAAALQPGGPLTPGEGARLEQRLAAIVERGRRGSDVRNAVVLPEREVNAYLEFRAQLPPGVTQVRVALAGGGRVAARARIDLQAAVDSVPGALRRMRGTLPVAITARLEATNGIGRIAIESMTVAGLSLPAAAIIQLVDAYARQAVGPEGFDLSQPFALPHGIRRISVDVGEVVVVQ